MLFKRRHKLLFRQHTHVSYSKEVQFFKGLDFTVIYSISVVTSELSFKKTLFPQNSSFQMRSGVAPYCIRWSKEECLTNEDFTVSKHTRAENSCAVHIRALREEYDTKALPRLSVKWLINLTDQSNLLTIWLIVEEGPYLCLIGIDIRYLGDKGL